MRCGDDNQRAHSLGRTTVQRLHRGNSDANRGAWPIPPEHFSCALSSRIRSAMMSSAFNHLFGGGEVDVRQLFEQAVRGRPPMRSPLVALPLRKPGSDREGRSTLPHAHTKQPWHLYLSFAHVRPVGGGALCWCDKHRPGKSNSKMPNALYDSARKLSSTDLFSTSTRRLLRARCDWAPFPRMNAAQVTNQKGITVCSGPWGKMCSSR